MIPCPETTKCPKQWQALARPQRDDNTSDDDANHDDAGDYDADDYDAVDADANALWVKQCNYKRSKVCKSWLK